MNRSSNACYECGKTQELFKYNCGHSFCVECTLVYVYARLEGFYSILVANNSALDGKCSSLGCKFKCKQGQLSLSLRYLVQFINNSTSLNQEKKISFIKFVDLGNPFFSGLSCYFFVCFMCKNLKNCLKFKLLICKECISELCVRQINHRPKAIFIDWQIGETEFLDKESMFDEYTLVLYNPEAQTYVFEFIEEILRVSKLVKYTEKCQVCIVRAVSVGLFNAGYIDVENHVDTIQNIALITLVG